MKGTRRRTRGGVPTPPRPLITTRGYLASRQKAKTPSYIGPKNPQNTAEDIKNANERRAAATKAAAAAAAKEAAEAEVAAHFAKYKALTDAGNLFREAKERTAAARAAAAAAPHSEAAAAAVTAAEKEEASRRAGYMTIRQTYNKVANNSGVKLPTPPPPPDDDDDAGLAAAFRNLGGGGGRRRTRKHRSRRRHTKPRTRGRTA
jgi:hypothetical protein